MSPPCFKINKNSNRAPGQSAKGGRKTTRNIKRNTQYVKKLCHYYHPPKSYLHAYILKLIIPNECNNMLFTL